MAQKSPQNSNTDTLTVTLQSKFVHVGAAGQWLTGWPLGPMVKNATVELVPLGVKSTSDGMGKAVLDASKLKNGGYLLRLTPAAANTWEEKKAGTYGSDTKMTARYRPVELSLTVSRDGDKLEVTTVEVPDTASREIIV
ncbi:MAG TPA: hypothetical protein VK458_32935, partial [Myxococcaceae bacterium]|nr:hypothetical protein [Myxococcaceae bacterium]